MVAIISARICLSPGSTTRTDGVSFLVTKDVLDFTLAYNMYVNVG